MPVRTLSGGAVFERRTKNVCIFTPSRAVSFSARPAVQARKGQMPIRLNRPIDEKCLPIPLSTQNRRLHTE